MTTDIIPEPLGFEWDRGNIDKNFEKHGVRNEESETVFFDEHSVLVEDLKHSKTESRYQIFGKSDLGSLLTIFFTIRSKRVRIISARQMNAKERSFYQNKK